MLKVGTEGSNPPFNYFEGSELKGFDVDLIKAVCQRMARRCEFVTRSIDQLPLAMKRQEIDIIVSALPLPVPMPGSGPVIPAPAAPQASPRPPSS